jgi:hypothetical protein
MFICTYIGIATKLLYRLFTHNLYIQVDSSAKERPDYRIKANGKMTLRGKVCGLLTRIGTKLKHSDVPKGTTDKKSCSSVPEAFRDYKNEDPKQTKICHWCEDSCVSNSAPSTSQASVSEI